MGTLLLLLLVFVACFLISLALSALARVLFPKFRSGEFKPGSHRSDLPPSGTATREIKTIELPLVGGPAFTVAIVGTGIGAGYLFQFSAQQWTLLLIGLGATFGFMLVGLIDDWNKVYSKEGLSERAKLAGVILVSITAALLFFFLLPNSREPYTPYKEILDPILSILPRQIVPYVWLVFFLFMTGVIGSVTSLSVDFSDGLDGLAGGLVFSAALAFGIIVTGIIDKQHPEGIVLELLSLLCAGGVLGYLLWNWPSAWAARRGTAKRRAKIIMGDSGALGLGGILAMIAIFSHQEISLLLIGAAFVLEGLSALISARMMTPFFRQRLQLLRFASGRERVPHTEFPLPFLATPLHHHFDLLGWDRRRLVYGAWALGACFAGLGVLAGLAPATWQRYLGRILVLILAWIVWSSGSWSRRYFVGKHPAERTRRRRLALYYGYPYRLMGIRLYHMVEIIEASEDVIETPAEELALWQRINIFDARAMLGLYCYRAGYYPAALAQWTRIPEGNRALRPEIARLLAEVDTRIALEKQETQPMRRDQILKEPPIITGNFPPADLPNPYEPIRSEETVNTLTIPFTLDDEDDEEEHKATTPLGSDGTNGNSSSNGHTFIELDTHTRIPEPIVRQNWFMRLFRPSINKGN